MGEAMSERSDDDRDPGRLPPGQFLTDKWPVLTYGRTPEIDLEEWRFRVWGAVEEEHLFTWREFLELGETSVEADFHCVTTWSVLDNEWEGIPAARLLEAVPPLPEATHVMIHCYGGYSANLPIEDLQDPSVLFARYRNGAELTPEHGWPLRLIVPHRYAWKSAKWVRGAEFLTENERGFWERYGYHNNADPWNEERYG